MNRVLGKIFKQKAFTLIELIMIIVIISSLAVVAIPIWLGENHKLSTTTDELVQSILYIQQLALSEGKNTLISFNFTQNSYSGFRKDFSGNTPVLIDRYINNNISVSSSQPELEFDGTLGLPVTTANPFLIELITANRTVQISINNLGEVSVT